MTGPGTKSGGISRWQPTTFEQDRANLSGVVSYSGPSLALFRQQLAMQKAYLDQHPAQTGKMLTIYAWNEWGEGGVIEPSAIEQSGYLDAICQTFFPSVTPAMALDAPIAGSTTQPFLVAGWAIDLPTTTSAGVDAVHVYAFPVTNGIVGSGIFLGAAATGAARPDVGAVFGGQFTNAGYGLFVSSGNLMSGQQYILGIYAHGAVTGTFDQSTFITVTIR